MIVKTSNLLSPDVNILINGAEVNYASINRVVLNLDENKHDVCTIALAGIPPKAITDYIDKPVRVFISSGPGRSQEFCGYVTYVEPVAETRSGFVNQSPFQMANLVCFGTSVDMKGSKNRVWENATLPIIAQTLADRYSFSLDVYNDTFSYPRIVQSGESDWSFLLRVCNMYGMRMTVHGTHMHIWDPFKAIGRLASFNRLLTMRTSLGNLAGTILNFTGTFGYVTPDGVSTNYQTASVDKFGTILISNSAALPDQSWTGNGHSSKFFNEINSTPQSFEEAEREMAMYNRKYFAFNAVVEIIGGMGIVPGGVVELSEYNANFDGLWYVKSVDHEVGGNHYTSTLHIGRDFNITNEFFTPPVERYTLPPAPILVNNTWEASVKRVNKYV